MRVFPLFLKLFTFNPMKMNQKIKELTYKVQPLYSLFKNLLPNAKISAGEL